MIFTPPRHHTDFPDLPDDLSRIDPNSLKSKRGREILRKYELLKEQEANEMAQKIAEEKHKKRSYFFLDLFKALIIAVITLVIEHFMDIVRLIKSLLE